MSREKDQTELLERDAELDQLRELGRRAAGGEGTVVAVRGTAGIGKTALIRAASDLGAAADFQTLRASGAELERELAFGITRQLFERPLLHLAGADRDVLLEGAAGLARTAVLEPQPTEPRPEATHAAMHGLYWLTAGWAARQPLLLAVDDAHWADVASLRWLAYLARRLDGLAVLVLVGARDAEPGADTALLDQLLLETGATVLRPRPLTRSGVEVWLTRARGRSPSRAFVDGCWNSTGGNPLLLAELTAELRAEGLQLDDAAARRIERIAPSTIARSMLMRLARLGPSAAAVAESVAILSQEARLDRVAALAELSLAPTAEIIDQLVASGILSHHEPLAFAHPVLRTAVYEQIPRLRRGLAHAAAARRLLEDGGGPERAGPHLLLAPPANDQVVVRALQAAAASALARGAPDVAIALLRRALAEPPADRVSVLLELAGAEATVQDPAAVEHARDAMAAAGEPRQHAEAAIVVARTLTLSGRFAEAQDALTDAERNLGDLDRDARLALRAEALMQQGWHRDMRDFDERLTALGVDDLPGATPAERALLAIRVMENIVSGRQPARALELARRLLAREDAGRRPDVEAILGLEFAIADEIDEAREHLAALIDRGRAHGDLGAVAWGCAMRAETELRAGRLTQADTDAREALAIALEHDINVVVPTALAYVVEILIEQRPAANALGLLAGHGFGGSDAVSPGYTSHMLLHARGRAHAAGGDFQRAVADFRACGEAHLGWGDRNPATIPWRSNLALVLGRTAESLRLVEEELDLAREFGARRAIGIASRARALLGRGDAAIRGLAEAADTLASSPARLEYARALVDLGASQRRAGQRTRARGTLRQGLDAADRCRAHQLSARARAELNAAGSRPRRERLSGPEALTASERRVTELAAQGLSNRQVAQALFITAKTVEMHLRHAYTKLGITRRSELAPALATSQEPDQTKPTQETAPAFRPPNENTS